MLLTVLGCAGTFPAPDSPCSSYLIEHDGFRLLVDAGNGALGNLQRCKDLLDLDAVLISHLHGDHYLDLATYTYARRYHPDGAAPRLPLFGPPGMRDALTSLSSTPGLVDEVYDVRPLGAGRQEIGPFQVDLARVDHPLECYGMRIAAGGRTLTYSADTGECEALTRLARDADLFLCEASYLDGDDNPPAIHLTGKQAGEYATRAGARRLLLTHLVAWGDEKRTLAEAHAAYDGPSELAACCTSYDV